MIRCDNCGTNNIDGSEYCDECGVKLDLAPAERRVEPPIYQPPSAVQSEPLHSDTMEGPLPTPPSFTTSTSIPKPAMPARDVRRNEVQKNLDNEFRTNNSSRRRNLTSERPAQNNGPVERPAPEPKQADP